LTTIEPKPTKMGGGPFESHSLSALYATFSASPRVGEVESVWHVPITRTYGGQSAGLGTKAGDHMYEKGTRSLVKSEPAKVPERIDLNLRSR
jgi:hypothetical protein